MKSILRTNGNFRNRTVGSLLNSLNGINHLAYSYFCYERISFVDEVLTELGITPEIRIDKPGKINRDDYNELRDKHLPKIRGVTRYQINRDNLKSEEKSAAQKGMVKAEERRRKTKSGNLNKLYLTRKNHGH